ncbi:MAG TPA: hypothetical protein VHO06_08815, partial [Polyangia bacterium]|nr:hypothetical protein [Polyangia bacterium]
MTAILYREIGKRNGRRCKNSPEIAAPLSSLASRATLPMIGDARFPTRGGADARRPEVELETAVAIFLRARGP